jgi:ABC-2 type transport system permease protein
MATAFTQNVDTSALLRFPLTYRTYFFVRLVFGTLDIATALGLSWSLGLTIGISAAAPHLIPWAFLAVLGFVVFNLLLSRTVFVWIEHWLSRRRSREVMGLLFFVIMIAFQFVGPALNRYSKEPAMQRFRYAAKLEPVQRILPPGLAATVLTTADAGKAAQALAVFALIVAYSGAALWMLHLRLQQQYRGENPEGDAGPKNLVSTANHVNRGWKLPLFPAPISAVFEKEVRYFFRSGPMLFTMLMPLVVILLLSSGKKSLLAHQSDLFFPIGAGYCLLVMTNLVYNSFGGDGGGIQAFLMAPVPFRQIVFAKNLAQLAVLIVEIVILLLGISFIYRSPHPAFLALTFCWYLFAAPVNFGAGNLLSIYSPKRIDYAVFGRQRAAETTIFASLGIQAVVMGTGALAILLGYHYSDYWLSTVVLAVLAVPSIVGYVILLRRIDRIILTRREVLASELCRA